MLAMPRLAVERCRRRRDGVEGTMAATCGHSDRIGSCSEAAASCKRRAARKGGDRSEFITPSWPPAWVSCLPTSVSTAFPATLCSIAPLIPLRHGPAPAGDRSSTPDRQRDSRRHGRAWRACNVASVPLGPSRCALGPSSAVCGTAVCETSAWRLRALPGAHLAARSLHMILPADGDRRSCRPLAAAARRRRPPDPSPPLFPTPPASSRQHERQRG